MKPRRSEPGKANESVRYYTCAFCGGEVKTNVGWRWTYQRRLKNERSAYFCSWSCMCKFDNGAPVNRWVKPIKEE